MIRVLLIALAAFSLSACQGLGLLPPVTVVVGEQTDRSDWPRDRCGEPYRPGTTPPNLNDGTPCR